MNEAELWANLIKAAARRDLFWVFFYAEQLSTVWAVERASKVLPVIKYDS